MKKKNINNLSLKKITISRLDLHNINGGFLDLDGGASNAPDPTPTVTNKCNNKPCFSEKCPPPPPPTGGGSFPGPGDDNGGLPGRDIGTGQQNSANLACYGGGF